VKRSASGRPAWSAAFVAVIVGAVVLSGCNLPFATGGQGCTWLGDFAQDGEYVMKCEWGDDFGPPFPGRWTRGLTIDHADDWLETVTSDPAPPTPPGPAHPEIGCYFVPDLSRLDWFWPDLMVVGPYDTESNLVFFESLRGTCSGAVTKTATGVVAPSLGAAIQKCAAYTPPGGGSYVDAGNLLGYTQYVPLWHCKERTGFSIPP
jgi:hypothetical protein